MGISMQEWREGEKAGCEQESLGSNQRKVEEPNTERGDGGGRAGGNYAVKLEKTKSRRLFRHGQPE
eukprot:8904045-Heterocapsa_arctica.AAC.1